MWHTGSFIGDMCPWHPQAPTPGTYGLAQESWRPEQGSVWLVGSGNEWALGRGPLLGQSVGRWEPRCTQVSGRVWVHRCAHEAQECHQARVPTRTDRCAQVASEVRNQTQVPSADGTPIFQERGGSCSLWRSRPTFHAQVADAGLSRSQRLSRRTLKAAHLESLLKNCGMIYLL